MLWSLILNKKMQGAISALSLNNIFYIVKKLTSTAKAYLAVETAASSFKVIEVTAVMVRKTLQERWPDFEDALQLEAAKAVNVDAIVTRNKKHFQQKEVRVLNPEEFVEQVEPPQKP